MTKSERNGDEARDVMGVRHGASDHERERAWGGALKAVAWVGLSPEVGEEGADLFASLSKMGGHWSVLNRGFHT